MAAFIAILTKRNGGSFFMTFPDLAERLPQMCPLENRAD